MVSCTGATGLVITAEQLAAQGIGTDGRRRFLLDLALPHDVERAVRNLPDVELAGLDDLRTAQEAAQAIGPEAVEAARRIVCTEVEAFLGAARAAAVAPTVVALRSKAAGVVEAELTRLSGRMPQMDVRARKEIEQTVRRVVDKLLHAPTVKVKELAAAPGGDSYADALRELFDLDPKAPEAVARADMGDADVRDGAAWDPSPECAEADCVSPASGQGQDAVSDAMSEAVSDAMSEAMSEPPSDGVNVETVNARAASVRAVSARDAVPAHEGDEA